jgi:hypothetical protein
VFADDVGGADGEEADDEREQRQKLRVGGRLYGRECDADDSECAATRRRYGLTRRTGSSEGTPSASPSCAKKSVRAEPPCREFKRTEAV